MADLKDRFRAADAVTAPDLWSDIRERTPGSRVPQPRPYAPLVVGLAIATAGIILAVSVFTDRGPGVRPAGPPPNGPIAFSAFTTAQGGPRREAIFLLTSAAKVRQITPAIGLADPAWSPDGTRIAVTTGTDRHQGGIGVMNADGRHRLTIVRGAFLGQPSWSPDGSRIAFVDGHDIDTIDAAGGTPRTIASFPRQGLTESPAWSPDGVTIALARQQVFEGIPPRTCPSASQGFGIVTVSAHGSGLTQLTRNLCDSNPVWSPDGKEIAFARTAPNSEWSRIMIMGADGSALHAVASCTGPRAPAECRVDDLSWSPDGRQLAFVRAGAIYTMNATGGEANRVAIPPGLEVTAASWGPAAVPTTPQPTPSPTATQGGGTTAQTLVRLPGVPFRMVGTGDAVYVLTQSQSGSTSRLVRYGLRSPRRLTISEPMRQATGLAVGYGSVWVSGSGLPGVSDTGLGNVVYRLDPTTLKPQGSMVLPASAGNLAVGPTGVWVGAGDAVYLLNRSDGRMVHSVSLPMKAGDLAVGPQDRLYVDTYAANGDGPGPIVELDATTGRLLATGPTANGVSWTGLSPVSQGVWASIATGLLGRVVLLRAGDLHEIAHVGSSGQPDFAGTNGVRAWAVGGVLWVGDPVGRYACADPSTGVRRARPAFRYGGVTEAAGGVYAVFLSPSGEVGGLTQITPGPDCLG
jgi:Tol biopolymer transport system component